MVQTNSNGKYIFSVDMMFAYINIFKPKSKTVTVSSLIHNLEHNSWGNGSKKERFSALDVINNPTKEKFKDDIKRIMNANLK